MPGYIDNAVTNIDDRLRELNDEVARLEAARTALTGAGRRRGRPAGNGTSPSPARSAGRRNGRSSAPSRRGGNTRSIQALAVVRERPGITIPELAEAMKIQPNYLYRVMPGLATAGEVRREGQGWHPAESSSPEGAAATPRSTPRRRAGAARPKPKSSTPRTRRSRRNGQPRRSTRTRRAPGTTRTSVLAAFSDGEVLTAGQIAEKTGLGRNTVATTLSRLAKRGELQKAQRGYRHATGAAAVR